MPANPWDLRADVRPMELAATRWMETAMLLSRRGDEIVDAARRATEGWDAAAAESYERHRREVLVNLDRFTQLATQIAGSLRAVSALLTSGQKELDQSWTHVALVPHEMVGESGHLVFHPSEDDDRGKVTRGQADADDIRRRLTLALDQESTRLRAARAELVGVRTELTTLAGGAFAQLHSTGEPSTGVGTLAPTSTSVRGSAQSGAAGLVGAAGLPPIAPISVSMPELGGLSSLSAAGVASLAATAASGLAGGRDKRRTTNLTPPMSGMGGAMGARAGTMSRGMASGRSGPRRLATPTLPGASDDEAARAARDKEAAKQAEKDAKRAALAEKRAERAARKAERESERDERRQSGEVEPEDADVDLDELDVDVDVDEDRAADLEVRVEDAPQLRRRDRGGEPGRAPVD